MTVEMNDKLLDIQKQVNAKIYKFKGPLLDLDLVKVIN